MRKSGPPVPPNRDCGELLLELLRWFKLVHRPTVLNMLNDTLTNDKDRRIYHLSDGTMSSREIAQQTGVTHTTVVRLWKTWAQKGLMEPCPSVRGRYRHVVPLSEVGLADEEDEDSTPGQ